jgi:DNA sulfur modification protein DndD
LTYAESLLDELQSHYKEKEDATRIELENRMNNIFKLIYDGGFQLSIDEKYAIRIQIENNEIETSTGQSLSVIFAFISGVIEMAKERVNDEELKTEPFPLVMDAPLSAFDKTRIETISNTIPRIAEQVIIFIKDTDGELAEQYIGNKMGKKYVLKKVANSEFITEVYER